MQGQEKVHVVGQDPRSSLLPPLSAISSRPDFKDPSPILQSPILSASYPSLPLKTHLLPRARGLRSTPRTRPSSSGRPTPAPLPAGSDPSAHTARSYILFSFSLPEALATEIYYDVKR